MIDVTLLPDNDLTALLDAARAENQKRWELRQAYAAAPDLQAGYLESIGRGPGEPWKPATGYENAYPIGWVVEHGGKQWESLVAANVWRPGESGWREIGVEGAPVEWVQPSGAHDAYQQGDQVTHDGHLWESTIDHNVWEPGTTGSMWTDLGPVDEYNPDNEGENQ